MCFYFSLHLLKSSLFHFQATDIWAIGVTLYCFVIGRVSLHVLYFTSIQVCEYMYFVKLISEEKKLNRLYNTFIVINFIDTNIYHFIIWNLIYLIIHSVTMRFFVMQCPFEDDFPLSLHKKIMNDPVKFPEKYVWNSNYNIVLNQRLEISFPYMLGIFHINMHNICFIIMYIFIYYLTLIFDVVGLWLQKDSKILFWRCSIKIQKHE